MNNKNILFILLIFTIFCSSCTEQHQANRPAITKQRLIEVNKMLVSKDSSIIAQYNDSLMLNLQQTNTGLWIKIERCGGSEKILKGDKISINYTVCSLNGDIFYTSKDKGARTFTCGIGSVENGLDEAVLLMNYGDKATIIMSPNQAFGIAGDDDKIKGRIILRYDIQT